MTFKVIENCSNFLLSIWNCYELVHYMMFKMRRIGKKTSSISKLSKSLKVSAYKSILNCQHFSVKASDAQLHGETANSRWVRKFTIRLVTQTWISTKILICLTFKNSFWNHQIPTLEGMSNTIDYRVYLIDSQTNKKISPWHSISFNTQNLFHYINEIPFNTTAKFEISTTENLNPIKQDIIKKTNHIAKFHLIKGCSPSIIQRNWWAIVTRLIALK